MLVGQINLFENKDAIMEPLYSHYKSYLQIHIEFTITIFVWIYNLSYQKNPNNKLLTLRKPSKFSLFWRRRTQTD